jgi:DNA-binding transcriptional MerR regulator
VLSNSPVTAKSSLVGKYLIRDFEALSGIKAHTIRIWEQRYGILKPDRSQTNIRQYNDDDLRYLLNISLLNRNGMKISALAKMKRAEIEEKVKSITSTNFEYSNQIDALTLAMAQFNEAEFERIINMNIAHLRFETAIEEIVFPFLRKIGVMWQTGSINPAQEHFMSNLIRQKLIVAIDRIENEVEKVRPKTILFLPEGELHELPLLYLNYLLKRNGHHVMYLGQNVPFNDLEQVDSVFRADYVFSIFTSYPRQLQVAAYVHRLSKIFPRSRILLSGFLIFKSKLKFPANIRTVMEIKDLREIIGNGLIPSNRKG